MDTSMTSSFEAELEEICSTTIAKEAADVDRDGAFPARSVEALKSARLLGALSSSESGGLGLGLAGAMRIVRRLAEECGSTAMVATMHYTWPLRAWIRTGISRSSHSTSWSVSTAITSAASARPLWR